MTTPAQSARENTLDGASRKRAGGISMAEQKLVPVEFVERRILTLRGQKVILDSDLAELYGVETRRLNEQVKRNLERFPSDFAFQLTLDEYGVLKSQSAISRGGHGGRRTAPHAFTEHGAIMAANVLRSDRAIEMSVFVVRAFVRLRGALASQTEMLRKLEELEERVGAHDETIQSIVAAIRQLMSPAPRAQKIGFDAEGDNA